MFFLAPLAGGQGGVPPLDFGRHVRAPPGVLVIKFRNPVVNGLSTTFVELRGALVPPLDFTPKKNTVHAVILSYSTSKSIDGTRRYLHLTLVEMRFFVPVYIGFPCVRYPPPHEEISITMFNFCAKRSLHPGVLN